jgi:hypothetical protein
MNRTDFLNLLALPGKRIDQDLVFDDVPTKAPNRVLRSVEVFNTGGVKVRLEGHYTPALESVTFVFVCPEAGGPICRVDVRGTNHKAQGRTHKHDLQRESDPRHNLPTAVARPDLEASDPSAIWADLCSRAGIKHTGQFVDPSVRQLPIHE